MSQSDNKYIEFLYDSSEKCTDLLYLSGFYATDPFIFYRINGKSTIIVSPMEYQRACKQCREGVNVFSTTDASSIFFLKKKSPEYILASLIRITEIPTVYIPEYFPVNFMFKTQEVLKYDFKLSCEFRCIPSPFCQERVEKSPAEVKAIRASEKIAEAGLRRGIDILRESSIDNDGRLRWKGETLTSEILHGEVNAKIVRLGAIASHTIIASGEQTSDPHQEGTGPIYANVPIVFDIFPRSVKSCYYGDISRTVVKGTASDTVKRAFTAVFDAQRTAIDMLEPGVIGAAVHNKADEVMKDHGFRTELKVVKPYGFIHSLGHGVGLDIHEYPYLNRKNDNALPNNCVVTVEPGLYYPEWGGIRIEDTIHVTANGPENLTSAPIFLEIE